MWFRALHEIIKIMNLNFIPIIKWLVQESTKGRCAEVEVKLGTDISWRQNDLKTIHFRPNDTGIEKGEPAVDCLKINNDSLESELL